MNLEVIRRIFEPLRILGLLIYKSLLIRKRHWAWTIFCEILIPVGLVYLSRFEPSPEKHAPPDKNPKIDSHYQAQSSETLMNEARDNTWHYFRAEELVHYNHDEKCPRLHQPYSIGFQKENDFIAYYKKYAKSWFDGELAVIFDEAFDQSTKSLSYKIRNQGNVDNLYNSRTEPMNLTEYYTVAYSFAQTQICVDRSFVTLKSGAHPIPDGNLMFHVSPSGTTWRKMYDVMYGMKKKYDCIDDFLVLSASLEQLFLMFARTSSASPSPQRNR